MFSHSSSFLLHISASAPPSLADLTKDTFLTLRLPLHYYYFDGLGFPLCVYICFNMPCTFCGWISILVYVYIQGFLKIGIRVLLLLFFFPQICEVGRLPIVHKRT
jgi:hypothetical protein